jgi:hypothetical protein
VHRNLPLGWRDFLDTTIIEEEMKAAVSKELEKSSQKRYYVPGFLKLTVTT